jgi:hypothetical protein
MALIPKVITSLINNPIVLDDVRGFDGTYIWVGNTLDSTLSKLLASNGTPAIGSPFSAGPNGVLGMCYDGTYIWVVGYAGSTSISWILASSGALVGTTYEHGTYPSFVAYDGANVWVTNNGGNSVTKYSDGIGGTAPTSTSPGTLGQVDFDATYLYICVATNTWVRAALSSF